MGLPDEGWRSWNRSSRTRQRAGLVAQAGNHVRDALAVKL